MYDINSDVEKRLPKSEENGISPDQLLNPMKILASYVATLVHLTQNHPKALLQYINDMLNHDLPLQQFLEERVTPLSLPSKSVEHKKLGEVLFVLKKILCKDDELASHFVREISLSKGALLTAGKRRSQLSVRDLRSSARKNFLDKLSCMLEDSLIDLNQSVLKSLMKSVKAKL